MKKLVITLSSLLLATTVHASSSNVELFAQDSSVETNLCLVAGQNGYQAAKVQAKKLGAQFKGLNFLCNGLTVKKFAKEYNTIEMEVAQVKQIVLVPANQTQESQLCVEAAKNGVRSIGYKADALKCNGDSVARFVRKVNNS